VSDALVVGERRSFHSAAARLHGRHVSQEIIEALLQTVHMGTGTTSGGRGETGRQAGKRVF
jgi:hypothetical protein